MAEEELLKVDPNTADEEALKDLPGIGRALAEKIIASRPFSGVEDLQKIRGLGKVSLERLKPYLSFAEPEPEKEQETLLSPDGQEDIELDASEVLFEAEEGVQPEIEKTVEKTAEKKESFTPVRAVRAKGSFSRTETLWVAVGAGFITLVLSVLVNLAIIGGINGTLDFNRLQTVRELESDLSDVKGDLETISLQVRVFEERLTPLEGLTGRVMTVEEQMGSVQEDVTEALSDVESMQADLVELSDETARLTGRVDRFDAFLDGLRQIIAELFASPSEESMPLQ
jgi:ribosomal protein S13